MLINPKKPPEGVAVFSGAADQSSFLLQEGGRRGLAIWLEKLSMFEGVDIGSKLSRRLAISSEGFMIYLVRFFIPSLPFPVIACHLRDNLTNLETSIYRFSTLHKT